MKKIQLALIAIAVFTIVLVVNSLVRNVPSSKNSPKMENLPPREVDMQINDVYYEQINQDGFKEWELNADSAQFFKKENKIVLHELTVTLFSDKGKAYKLVADEGELHTDSKDVVVSGNVVANTEDGYQIKTNSLHYDAQKRTISTHDDVTIIGKDMVMKGKGMLMDLEKETLRLLEEVKASERK